MTINQVSVFAENRFGTIRNVTKALGNAGIDIRALSVADTEGFGVLRMIVSDTKKAEEVLAGQECILSITPVLGVILPDRPGGLSNVLSLLAEPRINIEYMYAFIMRSGESACVVIRVRENEKTQKILEDAGIRLLSEEEISAF